MLVPIPVAPPVPAAGAQLAEGDQLQVQLVLQLPRLLPEICTEGGAGGSHTQPQTARGAPRSPHTEVAPRDG